MKKILELLSWDKSWSHHMAVPSMTSALAEGGGCHGGFHHTRVKVFSHGHVPALAELAEQHGDWDRRGLLTEGGEKREKQKDMVQLYLGPNTARLWQRNTSFALRFEKTGGKVSHPFCTTICLSRALGATCDSHLWKAALFWLSISAM